MKWKKSFCCLSKAIVNQFPCLCLKFTSREAAKKKESLNNVKKSFHVEYFKFFLAIPTTVLVKKLHCTTSSMQFRKLDQVILIRGVNVKSHRFVSLWFLIATIQASRHPRSTQNRVTSNLIPLSVLPALVPHSRLLTSLSRCVDVFYNIFVATRVGAKADKKPRNCLGVDSNEMKRKIAFLLALHRLL